MKFFTANTRSIFLCLFIIVSFSGYSQQASISGKVSIPGRQTVDLVNVGLKGTAFLTQTDAQGNFKLEALPAGAYTLVIVRSSLSQTEKAITLAEGEHLDLGEIVHVDRAQDLEEITVNTVRNYNEKPVSIGKISIKPMDLPQSVAVIEKEVLEQQQTQSMSDVLRNFNGVYQMGNTGGVQQEIAARGFAMSSSNTFKNGVRFNNGILPEMSSLEKVEILKGSSAILFGNVAAGGVINLVTKKPTFTQGGEIGMRVGSYGFYKPMIDLYGTLDKTKTAAYRLTTSYENAGSFRDNVSSERIYFNPSVAVKAGAKTDILIEGDYLKDNRTSDFGVGAINYQLIDVPRSRFLGAAWSSYKTEQKSLNAAIVHHFNRNWQIKSSNGYQAYQNELFTTMRPNANSSFVRQDGTWIRGVQHSKVNEQYLITQLDLSGKFNTGKIRHNLLVGADLDAYSTVTNAFNNLNKYDSINVFDLDKYKQRNDIPDLTRRTDTEVPITRTGIYAQDLVDLGKIKILAGARFSYLETGSRVYTYSDKSFAVTKQYDHATTPRLGLVYQPTRKISLFGSYANSFNPNSGVDVNGKQLAPSYFNQVEGGIKTIVLKDMISANLTVYQIVNSNLAQMSLANGNTNSNIKELAGEVTSKGLELDLMSKSFHGFMILAGYSYNETRYTRSNTYIVGSLLRYNPMHTANASVYHTVSNGKLKGLNAGLSAVYIGERMAGRSTRINVENDSFKLIRIPAYTLFDASLGYSFRQATVRLKVTNLLDALSYNVHDDNSVNPIAPRQVCATFSYKF